MLTPSFWGECFVTRGCVSEVCCCCSLNISFPQSHISHMHRPVKLIEIPSRRHAKTKHHQVLHRRRHRLPLPIIIYNFPGVTSGIDLDSDLMSNLAAANTNIVGCKLTCGNMGKLQRLAHDPRLQPSSSSSASSPKGFAAFAGKTDFMLPGLVAGSHGVIAATANLVPAAHVHMLKLYDEGRLPEAQALQTRFSRADWALVQLGVAGLKAALDRYYGYGGGRSRRPLGFVEASRFDGDADVVLRDLVDLENSL